jgi:hypothetical protein
MGTPANVLHLSDVTLCCVDAVNHALALRALERSQRGVRFGRTLFVTDASPSDMPVAADVKVVAVGPIISQQAYSQFVLKDLYTHITTSHVLLIQWDGYVIHADMWDDQFLATDYIGAPWPDGTVGNGGFSLRSTRLLAALQEDRFPLVTTNEDATICGVHRARLESEFAIRFADSELARRFSFEMQTSHVIGGANTFGFHGIFNLFLVEPEEEIATVAALLSDSAATSDGMRMLLWNLVNVGKWEAAAAVGRRILEANSTDARAHEMLSLIEDARVQAADPVPSAQAPTPRRRTGLAAWALRAMRPKKTA